MFIKFEENDIFLILFMYIRNYNIFWEMYIDDKFRSQRKSRFKVCRGQGVNVSTTIDKRRASQLRVETSRFQYLTKKKKKKKKKNVARVASSMTKLSRLSLDITPEIIQIHAGRLLNWIYYPAGVLNGATFYS